MLLNNHSHNLYATNKLKYDNIIDYIYDNLRNDNLDMNFKNIKEIINLIKKFKIKNETF